MTVYMVHLVPITHIKRLISDGIQLLAVSTAAVASPAVMRETVDE